MSESTSPAIAIGLIPVPPAWASTAERISSRLVEPVARYSRLNPYRKIAAPSAPRKKYLTPASWLAALRVEMVTMTYVGRLVSSSARNSQTRSSALAQSITPIMLNRKKA